MKFYFSVVCFVLQTLFNTVQTQTLENLALGKNCSQSSKYLEGVTGNDCGCAINNNIGTHFSKGDCNKGGNCVHTAKDDLFPAWTVDLGRVYSIQSITVFARVGGQEGQPYEDRRYRMKNVNVSVDGHSVYTFPLDNVPAAQTVIDKSNSTQPRQGRYVTLSRAAAYWPNGTLVDLQDYGVVLLNFCEVQVWVLTACASNPCQHGGVCQSNDVDVYSCLCPQGYTGTDCATNIDECQSNPCQNGGTCHDSVASYTCICRREYTGANCETDIDECESNPCQNGGTCHDSVASYTCTCRRGYTGANCETDIDECSPGRNPCNPGTCTNIPGSYTCQCHPGYSGTTSCLDINECSTYRYPCGTGSCSNTPGSYTCRCLPGYSGTTSCTDIDECSPGRNPCDPGRCTNLHGSYTCQCPTGYKGTTSCTDINECSPGKNPCNPGNCTNSQGSYICHCSPGYNGTKSCMDLRPQTAPGPIIDSHTEAGPIIELHTDAGPIIDSHTDAGPIIESHTDAGPIIESHTDAGPIIVSHTDSGPIVGAFFGGVVLTANFAILVFCIWKRRTNPRRHRATQQANTASAVLHREDPGPVNTEEETSVRPEPESSNEERRTSTELCYVNVDNTYEKLNPYNNDDNAQSDVYTGLQIKK